MLEYIVPYKNQKEYWETFNMHIDAFSLTHDIISKILQHRSFVINSPLYSDELLVERVDISVCPAADGFETGSIVATSTESFKTLNEKRVWFDWIEFNNFTEIYYLLDKIKKEFSIDKLCGSIFYRDLSFISSHKDGMFNYWDVKFGIIIANKK